MTPPTGSTILKNSWGKSQYNGPPKGSIHTYVFTLYALDTKIPLTKTADAKAVMNTLDKHVLQQTQLTAVFGR